MTQWQRLLAAGLMGILFTQLVMAIPQLSLTADEPVYMGAGYAFLRKGDLRMATSAQHPPLMQELVAAPLLLGPGPKLEGLEGWDTAEMARFARAFVSWYGDQLDAATFTARMPVVMVTLLWAAFLFRFAADWFGAWGGLVALTLFTLDPNILAHGTLATNDVGFAAFSFIALFAASRLIRRWPQQRERWARSSWGYLILAGVALGASLSAKSSGIFTLLALVALFILAALVGGGGWRGRLGYALSQLGLIVILGVLVLWATYGFELRPITEGGPAVPMATQWEIWREAREHLASGQTSYLMGEISDSGWMAYYPLAFLLKTPLYTLALFVVGTVAAVAAGRRRWLVMLPLWVYLSGYVAATMLSTVNTGYRFLLPLLPFVFILGAGLFREGAPWLGAPALRWGSWASLALLGTIVVARIAPHYLTYFNVLAGGPKEGYRYLVDSNLDWGQSFKALRAYFDEHDVEQSWLSHYTYADPALYGVAYEPAPPSPGVPALLPARFNPAPGVYAIGATTLQGVMSVDPDMYSWFRQREPEARPGNGIFVYRVEEPDPSVVWLAQCTAPVAPLTPDVAREGFGRDDLRLAYFDCTQSWLYPTGGQMAGWYALHRAITLERDDFIEGRLTDTHLSYEQRGDRASPAFVIYEQPTGPKEAACTGDAQPLDGPLDFLGYRALQGAVSAGETVELMTCWRVTGLPGASGSSAEMRPLSLMLHLVGPGGAPLVVGDGLGVPLESWQVGDVIVQRHRLAVPLEAPAGEYMLYTGAYWLDTLERWSILEDGMPVDDRVVLAPLTVSARR
jgi:4-amino-4-deoxy-L-arabinose transferase-like glycosyltransferase